ncbi:MAG: hypothetical protein UY48_C0005G0015 [Candidatus Gottesmanbacteria bacterium GW2011_GWB1_49_7]|uniref:Uncharacterized protein n=1 Tax=Candidatus Gottesmanbacteria bacterium GW2011_GWB1_49_7 TaxID=1618448 RepID=A0A0G1Z2Q4_9BACT|nr:MAG: hypothetical protein UY48_C0005G0015 [Candidatus Gottesmanbacteria bacterium GW2011_GWB1_49_7]
MIIAKKHFVPDDCPANCGFRDEPFDQGNTYSRCPIFNYRSLHSLAGSIINPEDFDPDAAEVYAEYF